MNIENFKEKINRMVLRNAENLVDCNDVYGVSFQHGVLQGSVTDGRYHFVSIRFDESGEIIDSGCYCTFNRRSEVLCEHAIALLCYAYRYMDHKEFDRRAARVNQLIEAFGSISKSQALGRDDEPLRLVPEIFLNSYDYSLSYQLKIGRDKLYIVKNVLNLYEMFEEHTPLRYGKNLTVTHDMRLLGEREKKLLDLSYFIAQTASYGNYSERNKILKLSGMSLDSFFELYKDEILTISDEDCYRDFAVRYGMPDFGIKIEKNEDASYTLSVSDTLRYLGRGIHACFMDEKYGVIYMTDPSSSYVLGSFWEAFGKMHSLPIEEKNMQRFYNAVLKQVVRYTDIEGIEMLKEYAPPEASARIYIDVDEEDAVYAKAEYWYGDKCYKMFYDPAVNPFCDYETESLAEMTVLKYFERQRDSYVYPLWIEKEKDIYRLMSEGMQELVSVMDVYTTERFARIQVRRPAKTVVGIKPSMGNVLELSITAEGYSGEELMKMLAAYRKGKKYYRLTDGAFAPIDESFAELSEMADNLNLTDKEFLKENIKIPMYRMLYLDSLEKDSESLRVERSRDFLKLSERFHDSVEDSEELCVPGKLDGIMREYQKYGFRWMKTIANYGFGGILADDMGLGKTLQAIALIKDEKEKGNTKPSFVVCPSSLVLNWENEVQKFASDLKCLPITGSAALRKEQIAHAGEYDVIVTSYSLLIRDIAEYENIAFRYEFIDEAQYIKNHSTQMAKAVKGIRSDIRFALTGTPVENSLAELWSIFDYIMPGYLFNYRHFRQNFEQPIVAQKNETQVKALQKSVSPFILRRLKKDVLKELPEKTVTILKSDMEAKQSKIYAANILETQKMLKDINDPADRIKVLAMLTKLRQICCDPSLLYENYDGGSAKLEQCMELVQDCIHSGHKILLFSQFTSMLDILAKRLDEAGIRYYTLTGSTSAKTRLQLVDKFNHDDTPVFLISLKAGGTGLNLTGADIVIHYDPWWNASAENQASDRVYRIGQKRNVQIYKLIANKSIEEKILVLQECKSELFDIAVSGTGDIMRMNAEDIRGLLE